MFNLQKIQMGNFSLCLSEIQARHADHNISHIIIECKYKVRFKKNSRKAWEGEMAPAIKLK